MLPHELDRMQRSASDGVEELVPGLGEPPGPRKGPGRGSTRRARSAGQRLEREASHSMSGVSRSRTRSVAEWHVGAVPARDVRDLLEPVDTTIAWNPLH